MPIATRLAEHAGTLQPLDSNPARKGNTLDKTSTVQSDNQPIFHVDARALKVFRALFYTPSVSESPGDVAWNDFLHAMVSTGFQPEKFYCGVSHFTPKQCGGDRGIFFNEPFPSGKLKYPVVRRYERRSNRHYGWERSMFVKNESGIYPNMQVTIEITIPSWEYHISLFIWNPLYLVLSTSIARS
ncbi:unnamed protein product [Periconia digitata]|uniref:Uncharacterized protein n=1 Tax=Periconia digitata TaxID=1303443 RepID=A0A9W4UAY1_9PLEO|nr:unnamed protein product [Periconia digitata]